MALVAFVFVGAVLLINGLVLLGFVPPRSSVPINLLVGLALAGTALQIILTTDALGPELSAASSSLWSAAGFMLFSFTYLTVAVNTLTGGEGSALGWYCLWAAAISAVITLVQLLVLQDPHLAVLWGAWAILFAAFFLAQATPWAWSQRPAGALAVMQSVTTATIPALLDLAGWWRQAPLALVLGAQAAVVVVYAVLMVRERRCALRPEPTVHTGPLPVTASA
ncbi:AmiS/UreI family transporter [Micrococcus sp. IITD107]|uniref:AmiS/UreI family transporter n=1 Tax=Micrococcus sp. IITD107 TaxID=3342790 RepID=UPI0035B7275F